MQTSIEKPLPDSQFRLLPCKGCKSNEVGYQTSTVSIGEAYRVKCLDCGQRTPWWPCKHDAQIDWNSKFGEGFR